MFTRYAILSGWCLLLTAEIALGQSVAVEINLAGVPSLANQLGQQGEARLQARLVKTLDREFVFWRFQPAVANDGLPRLTLEFTELGPRTSKLTQTLVFSMTGFASTQAGGNTLFRFEYMTIADPTKYAQLLETDGDRVADEILDQVQKRISTNLRVWEREFHPIPVGRVILPQEPDKVISSLEWDRFHSFVFSTFKVVCVTASGMEKITFYGRGAVKHNGCSYMVLVHADPPPLQPPVKHREILLVDRDQRPDASENTAEIQ